MSEEEIINHSR